MTPATPDSGDGQIRLLHVDDEPDLADMAAEFLTREDDRISIDTATSAGEGLRNLADRDYDCIVSDYDMPAKDGIDFLKAVREDWPDLPFILYTGKGSEEVASEAISAGVTDYLQKGTGTDQYTLLANRISNAVAKTRAEREVRRTREYFGEILKHASDFVMVVDETGQVDYISPAVERVLGYIPEELMGVDAFEHVHPEDITVASEAFVKVLEEPDKEHAVEYRASHADGSWRWLEVRGRNRLSGPIVGGIIVSAREITARKRREQRLREERGFNQLALDNLLEFYWQLDTEGHVVEWSDGDGSVTGYPAEEAEGMHATEFFPERERDYIDGKVTELLETGTVTAEANFQKKGGQLVPYRFTGSVLRDDDGAVETLCGFGQEIGELVERERELP